MSRDALVALARRRDTLVASIESNPIQYWKPNPGGQEDFMLCEDPDVRVFGLFAGNKTGKTTAGAIRFCETLLGRPLWDIAKRSVTAQVPSRGACFASDYDTHRETTMPTMRSWLPKGTIKIEHKNSAGYVTDIVLENGSVISFRTYDQGSDKAEGKDWVIVWCDEPPPRDVYVAIFRGLVVLNGKMLITATLLSETWLYDEAAEKPFVRLFEGSIHENLWINEGAKLDFLNSLTEDERSVRELGKPASLTGLVYKTFKASDPFVVPESVITDAFNDYPIIMAVDPHERRPIYVEYAFIAPDDDILWFKWALPRGSEDAIFELLADVEKDMPSKPVVCIMDPNRGRAKQIGRGSMDGTSWSQIFEEHDYNVYMGSDDIRSGHTSVRTMLAGERPAMRWTEACLGKGGPVWQMMRYSWESFRFGRKEREAPEKPKDSNKDFPDLHRYVAVAGLTFDALQHGDEVIERYKIEETGRPRAYL